MQVKIKFNIDVIWKLIQNTFAKQVDEAVNQFWVAKNRLVEECRTNLDLLLRKIVPAYRCNIRMY